MLVRSYRVIRGHHCECASYLSLAPTGAPQNVVPTTTSRSVSISWDEIDCIDQNGEITSYQVRLRRGSVTITDEAVVGMTFSASGLTPFTEYMFQVAGVNSIGRGPFTAAIPIHTPETCKFLLVHLCSLARD